jgi:membrane-associated phospholipid phosphatase
VLRVQAGRHFWTDVLTGALAGSLIGYLVPAWHRAAPASAEAAETSLRVGVAPLVLPDGLGIALGVW